MSNQSASKQFRQRVGLDPVDGGETEQAEVDLNDLDDTPAEPPLPTTGGETQMPGTERIDGSNASDLPSPPPQPGADEDGFGGDAPEPSDDVEDLEDGDHGQSEDHRHDHDKHDGDPV